MTRRALGWLIVAAVLLIAIHAVLASRFGVDDDDDLIINWTWLEIVPYALAAFVVLRGKCLDPAATRRAVIAILVVAGVLRAMVVTILPVSTDINRYIWDGRVQAAGINPYRYIPADPALAGLRDDDIYPEINRKEYARTIYPPFAQIVFFLVTRISETLTAMKAAMMLFDVVAIWALLRLLRRRGLPPTRILLYAWHPLPIWQFSGDGHVDAIAVAGMCVALLAAEAKQPVLAGLALGAATLTKFSPVVIGPALYRRWDWKLPLAGFLTIVALYAPYLGAGRHLFGFLSGYSSEEGYQDGSGVFLWILLKHFVPSLPQGAFAFYGPFTALVMGAIALPIALRRRSGQADLGGALALVAAFTILTSPHYIWYMTWLVPFVCLVPSGAAFWLSLSATFMNVIAWPNTLMGGAIVFVPALVLAVADVLGRRWARQRVRDEAPATSSGETPLSRSLGPG